MTKNSDNLRLVDWRPLKHKLHEAVVEKSLPVQLIFPPQHHNGIVRLEGNFLSVSDNVARFAVNNEDEISIRLKDGKFPENIICRVSIRVEPGVLPVESQIQPGEYVSNGVVTFLKGKELPQELQQDQPEARQQDNEQQGTAQQGTAQQGQQAGIDSTTPGGDAKATAMTGEDAVAQDGNDEEGQAGQDSGNAGSKENQLSVRETQATAIKADANSGKTDAESITDGRETRFRPTYLEIRISHQYVMRKTRQFDRTVWHASENSLVRLLVARPVPKHGSDLQALIRQAMRLADKSHDLVDISEGGALIYAPKDIAKYPILLGDAYLMLFSLHKQEQALPIVFLAKKVGALPPEQDRDGMTGLRLHFVSELDWSASNRKHLVWRDIDKNGSEELSLILQVSDKRGWLED